MISMSLLPYVNECAYDSIVLSDHAPISLTLNIPGLARCPPRWRLQTKWLQDPQFVKFLGDNIDNYFCANSDQTSAATRWEAFKAYIRGVMISYTSYKSKSHYRELTSFEAQIKALELDLYRNDSPEKHKELLLLRTRYKELSTNKIAANLLWLKQSYYDQGDKAGKLLAWRIKKMQSHRAINSIQLENGDHTVDPVEINSSFRAFYESLYRSEYPNDTQLQSEFLDKLDIPTMTDHDKTKLNKRLTVDELSEAVRNIKSGKTPGPDGIPIEIYKLFPDNCSPLC